LTAATVEVVAVVLDDEVELEQNEPASQVELDSVVVDVVVLEALDTVVVVVLDAVE
jgi:hypothetical protein